MNTFTHKKFNPKTEAEETICKAMRVIEDGMSAIKCNAHIFNKEYPDVYWDLQRILYYIDNYQLTDK